MSQWLKIDLLSAEYHLPLSGKMTIREMSFRKTSFRESDFPGNVRKANWPTLQRGISAIAALIVNFSVRLRGVFTTRHYTRLRLPYFYLFRLTGFVLVCSYVIFYFNVGSWLHCELLNIARYNTCISHRVIASYRKIVTDQQRTTLQRDQ